MLSQSDYIFNLYLPKAQIFQYSSLQLLSNWAFGTSSFVCVFYHLCSRFGFIRENERRIEKKSEVEIIQFNLVLLNVFHIIGIRNIISKTWALPSRT